MLNELRKLTAINGAGYVFSTDGGATPISRYVFNLVLAAELERIGIDVEEKKRRNLTPHAWRHFFNTTLRVNNVTDAKVRSVTGHVTEDMTEHYTHFNTREFSEVRTVQETLLIPENSSGF
jgi:integrase